jgi:hypothetical protein
MLLVPAVVASLLAGIAGGLVRAGAVTTDLLGSDGLASAAAHHAFLMICTFMGTVIGIERAVAVKSLYAWLPPFATGAAGLFALAGQPAVAAWLAVAGAASFAGVGAIVVGRQFAQHTVLLWVGAAAWLVGNLLHAIGTAPAGVIPWWFAFLILTIAAERLEMTRLMRRRAVAAPLLHAVLAALLAGCALAVAAPRAGGIVFGVSLVALSLWLLSFDIARRTIRTHGLSRYMAACLLLGYVWLGISGVAWCATSLGQPARDAALHALAIGFVFSMMLGHAPVILPALARIKVQFAWPFYAPLALLHGSLAWRLLRDANDFTALAAGAIGNALAIALFAGTMAGSAIAWRIRHSRASRLHRDIDSAH